MINHKLPESSVLSEDQIQKIAYEKLREALDYVLDREPLDPEGRGGGINYRSREANLKVCISHLEDMVTVLKHFQREE